MFSSEFQCGHSSKHSFLVAAVENKISVEQQFIQSKKNCKESWDLRSLRFCGEKRWSFKFPHSLQISIRLSANKRWRNGCWFVIAIAIKPAVSVLYDISLDYNNNIAALQLSTALCHSCFALIPTWDTTDSYWLLDHIFLQSQSYHYFRQFSLFAI